MKDINVVAIVKDEECFMFLFTNENAKQAERMAAKWASDPELNFSWYDVSVVIKKTQRLTCGGELGSR